MTANPVFSARKQLAAVCDQMDTEMPMQYEQGPTQ
jgi:hypothetical protein